jgi:DNA polymerase/3'-5' exonuclease PolX
MRSRALEMGYSLNEFGLYLNEKKMNINVTSEKDIFDFLKMEYVLPKDRN